MDDRDENVPLLLSFTTRLSIYLIFLVIKDLHSMASLSWQELFFVLHL